MSSQLTRESKHIKEALFLLRLCMGVFMVLQAVYIFLFATHTASSLSPTLLWAVGGVVLLGGIGILMAWKKTWTYSLGALIHISSFPLLLSFVIANYLFVIVQVPVLGAFTALILLREYDTHWSLDTLQKKKLDI